jgi:hypothetical protein
MNKKIYIIISFFIVNAFSLSISFAQDQNIDHIIQVTTVVQNNPVALVFSWPAVAKGYEIDIYRKSKTDSDWNYDKPLVVLSGTATTYTDNTVVNGVDYEYYIRCYDSNANPYTYIYGGVEVAQVDYRGKVILLVDDSFSTPLSTELTRLESDLTGDGWQVIRHDVSRSASVTSVKAIIKSDYDADSVNVKSVYLFGHIPVPYSGRIAWDSHPEHAGAWPCDGYYADMKGIWTDNTVNTTQSSYPANYNTIGDGKFDQDYFPALMTLQIGRVDLANMPEFSLSEKELLRQYLNKDHDFRQKAFTALPRAVIDNNFGLNGYDAEYFASCGWRSFVAMFPPSNVANGDYFTSTTTGSYLWAYGAGAGVPFAADGVGSTHAFATSAPKAVFNMLFGSYFGDWEFDNSFLKAPLASSGYGLSSCWAGRPYWLNHHMALGETLGYSTWITMRNTCYQSDGSNFNRISINLMGDPTLRMHPVAPPKNLLVSNGALSWTASAEPVIGYCIYRKNLSTGNFTKIATTSNTETTYIDLNAVVGEDNYMVRALKLEVSNSGSYLNLSQGAFANAVLPLSLINYTVQLNNNTVINHWQTLNEVNVNHINVQRSTDSLIFNTVGKVYAKGGGDYSFNDTGLPNYVTQLYYRLQIVDNNGAEQFSDIQAINLKISTSGTLSIFPNPVTGKQINLILNQLPKGLYKISFINSIGIKIQDSEFYFDGTNLKKEIDLNFNSGIYLMNIQSENYQSVQKVIVQ